MTRDEAVALVRDTIAAYYGITHLRFTTRGSFGGSRFGAVEVTTLGDRRSERRHKGTREQQLVAREAVREDGPWLSAMLVLDPDIMLASGCAETTGFDVDAAGSLSNRHGTRGAYEAAERRRRAQHQPATLARPRPVVDLDGLLVDYMALMADSQLPTC